MTHIIGTPPAPKRGATFADVPIGSDYECLGVRGHRLSRTRAVLLSGPRAGQQVTVDELKLADSVTLLTQPTPVEPEPDPSVTTYSGLQEGEWFEFPEEPDAVCLRFRTGYVEAGGTAYIGNSIPCSEPVHRVPASLVVHEEPTHVRLSEGELAVRNGQGQWTRLAREAGVLLLQALVRQGAAILHGQGLEPEVASDG